MPNGNNLHRVVMFRDDADRLLRVAPFSALESLDPADLWDYLEEYESITGGRAIAIPHNGNASNGLMFTAETFSGEPMDSDHARRRARWEPVVEVTQIKGDGETHLLLSTTDEFADFGTWDYGNLFGTIDKEPAMLRYEYARSALMTGLQLGAGTGVNPFQFGMIGASDAHNGLAAVEEDNFWGKSADHEPAVDRATGRFVNAEPASPKVDRWQQVASGYAGVWATENTRTAIFDAIQRREVYATTGPRIAVRFFAGWDFRRNLLAYPDYVQRAYRAGVPMGSELPCAAVTRRNSCLLCSAIPRAPILTACRSSRAGSTRMGARMNASTMSPGRGIATGCGRSIAASRYYRGSGDGRVFEYDWRPIPGGTVAGSHFDPAQPAFYYLRVLEIPTPRWPVYDRVRLNGQIPVEADLVQQERAYSSPIWYTPGLIQPHHRP